MSRHRAPNWQRPRPWLRSIDDFLRWKPIPPKTAKKLAEVCARLCRLLRDEVVEQMRWIIRDSLHLRWIGGSFYSRKPTTPNLPTVTRKR